MDDEFFYKSVEDGRQRVNSMNISEEEKSRLYSIIDETVMRHEEMKRDYSEARRYERQMISSLNDLEESQRELYARIGRIKDSLEEINESAMEIKREVPNIGKTIRAVIAAKFVIDNPSSVN